MDKDSIQTNIILPTDMWRNIKIFAIKHKVTMSQAIRQAIEFYLSAQ